MAKAKALRYNARKERGEIPSKEALANADPYRWYTDTFSCKYFMILLLDSYLHYFFVRLFHEYNLILWIIIWMVKLVIELDFVKRWLDTFFYLQVCRWGWRSGYFDSQEKEGRRMRMSSDKFYTDCKNFNLIICQSYLLVCKFSINNNILYASRTYYSTELGNNFL